ncbi:MAG: bifunctional folylpolyglutamate synthase/dihydrofolate synthase [Beijerinckiaceae bacterium]
MAASSAMMARFLALHPKKIDLSLDRMEQILPKLGNPHRRLPPTIHVAGTNGKGSTIAFMRAMLEATGKSVHVYTSPHLVRFHERIRLAGKLVDEERLVDAFRRCEEANGGAPITVFEMTTAAALLLFAETPADYLLLEVGLGGKFDATNVVDKPVATVITPVSLDHMEYLGDTVTKIAAEKAGILKRGCTAIFADQSAEGRAVLEDEARRLRAGPVFIGGQDFQTYEENGRLVYQDTKGLLDLPLPRLPGRHQHLNAGTAIATLRQVMGDDLTQDVVARGLTQADWPARLQRLSGNVLKLSPKGSEVWLDGGHNVDGGRVLSAAMKEIDAKNPRPLVMIAGMLSTKDSTAFLSCFAGLSHQLYAIGISGQDAARTPHDVADMAQKAGLKAESAMSLADALARINDRTWDVAPRILITGSLYLAGEVLAFDGTMPT